MYYAQCQHTAEQPELDKEGYRADRVIRIPCVIYRIRIYRVHGWLCK